LSFFSPINKKKWLTPQINNAQGFGFDIEVKNFSWKKLKQGRDNYIKGITDWYDGYLEKLGIDYIHGFGQLVNKNTVSVNGEEYTAEHIVTHIHTSATNGFCLND
jgi:glutathione reductase (NADPH)